MIGRKGRKHHMNTESNAQFIDFGEFSIGDMVKECACDGIMSKRCVRLFPDIPVVTEVGVCERCGEVWDGRLQ